jgi:hypothetical protein
VTSVPRGSPDGPYEGRILEADTGKPIEGAVVLAVWYKERPTVAGAMSTYYDARETVTDKNGNFSVPGMGLEILSSVAVPSILVFKAGYEYMGLWAWQAFKNAAKVRWEGEKAVIPIRKLTMEERMKKSGPPSPPDEAPLGKVRLMLREINRERVEQGFKPIKIWHGEEI